MDRTTKRRSAQRPARSGRPTLRLVYSGASVRLDPPRALSREPLLVGRTVGPGQLEIADDPRLSRKHAVLTLDGDALRVVDASSSATEINGRPVADDLARDGDVIRMGDSFFVFRAEDDPEVDAEIDGLLGVAPSIRRLRSLLALVGPTPATTLLVGETGTGKEISARALHAASGRRGPFIAVNCSAIPESLAESELFGHVAGSYTGARAGTDGLFRAAHGGTILLDEIGELAPTLQPKLLRALEERAVTPVGSTRTLSFDVRVVAATNTNLVDALRAGKFRPDLYARLAEMVIELPPLRMRREDVLLVLEGALEPGTELHADLVSTLLTYAWPFNVRELLKVASSMRIRARGSRVLDVRVLDDRFQPAAHERVVAAQTPEPEPSVASRARPGKSQLDRLLREKGGTVTEVARATGHSRRQVYRWLRKFGIDPTTYRVDDE